MLVGARQAVAAGTQDGREEKAPRISVTQTGPLIGAPAGLGAGGMGRMRVVVGWGPDERPELGRVGLEGANQWRGRACEGVMRDGGDAGVPCIRTSRCIVVRPSDLVDLAGPHRDGQEANDCQRTAYSPARTWPTQ